MHARPVDTCSICGTIRPIQEIELCQGRAKQRCAACVQKRGEFEHVSRLATKLQHLPSYADWRDDRKVWVLEMGVFAMCTALRRWADNEQRKG